MNQMKKPFKAKFDFLNVCIQQTHYTLAQIKEINTNSELELALNLLNHIDDLKKQVTQVEILCEVLGYDDE